MRRAALALVAAAAAWTLSASGAVACRYIPPASAEIDLARVDTLFVGRAETMKRIKVGQRTFVETRFRVSRTLKGQRRAMQVVRVSVGNSCLGEYRIGQVYVVPASYVPGQTYLHPGNPHFPLADYERAAGRRR